MRTEPLDAAGTLLFPAFGFVFFLFFAIMIAGLVYWVIALIEIATVPDHQYRAAGTEKLVWVLVVVLAGVIGALIWRFAERDKVRAAAGRWPATPPGWYADPATGKPRWWDGTRWT